MRVPVHLVAGWLGTGKTTVLRHLLGLVRDERVAVVVNDFGVAGFDAAVLGAHATVLAIDGGCLCCTAPRGFQAAMASLLDQGLERIFVEPTGLARVADLVDNLRRAPFRDRIALRPVIVVVDPARLDQGREGAAVADVLVANRIDLATPAQMHDFRALVAALWPAPLAVVETHHGVVWADVLDGVAVVRQAVAEVHAVGDWSSRTWVWPPELVASTERLRAALSGSAVQRVKGLLRTDTGWQAVHQVNRAWHAEPTEWRRDSRLDVVVRGPWPEGLDARVDGAVGAGTHAEVGLEVDGPTGRRAWSMEALRALPGRVDDAATLLPGRAGPAAPVSALLDASDGAAVVVAADGFVAPPVPVTTLRQGWLLLDQPVGQGGPIRLVIPGSRDACANVKGVVRIAVRPARDE